MKRSLTKLNLGCGKDIRKDFLNVDSVKYPGVDKRFDLNKTPWPLEDNSFEFVMCYHILEHLPDFHKTVMEIHRVCKPGAIIEIRAPYFLSTKYFGDPDHKIPFSYRTFDNYTAPRKVTFYNKWRLFHTTNYGVGFPFKTIQKKYIFDRSPLLSWFGFFHNVSPSFYERFIPAFLPPMEVYFKLEVLKK
jgi:ubiquinone/menaquinone biosynthesis C-methylase UbiE